MVVQPLPRIATVLTLTASLVLPASVALAQDETGTDASETIIFMPETVMGQPLETSVLSGPDVLGSMDPENPEHVQQLEDLNGLLADAGASMEQFHIGSGQAIADEDGVVVLALRVEGIDMGTSMDPWLDFLATAYYELPETSEGELGDKAVTIVVDGDYPFDDPPRSFAYAAGDTLWFVGGTEDWAAEVIGALPA